MHTAILASTLICSMWAFGQETAKPAPTAEEILEKAIQADGGREAVSKMTSMVAKGTMEIVAMGASAIDEPVRRMHSSYEYGVLAMDTYRFGV